MIPQLSKSSRHIQKQGFSLIELLVVIAIIAVLASLILPTLGRSKAQAKLTVCLNNLRQIGAGFSMYTDDSRGLFPPSRVNDPEQNLSLPTYLAIGGTEALPEYAWFVPRPELRPLHQYVPNGVTFHCPEDRGMCGFT